MLTAHGAAELGRFLDGKCDFFGVACIEEAIELKKAGLKTPIVILGHVDKSAFDEVINNEIRVPIFNFDDAKALSDRAEALSKNVPFHFCLDTGMSRIGFQCTEESADICAEIAKLPNIEAEGIFSHFATADEADLTKALAQQKRFEDFCKMLEARGVEIPIKHINNSAGIINFEKKFDMCRMGIILYGLYPSDEVNKSLVDLKPVMTWKTHIAHIKTLEAGREISYGGTYKTAEPRENCNHPRWLCGRISALPF
jgi:alanine racemase